MFKQSIITCLILITAQCTALFAQNGKSESGNTQGNGAVEALSIAERADREVFFETNIRPILIEKCVKCHNENKAVA